MELAMEHAIDTYYQKNNISRERLVPKMGEVGLNLESMELAIPKENHRLIEIEEKLNSRIVGQPEAIKSIMAALARGEFRDPNRPIANILFMGPTGVGKTELAQELASILHDGNLDGVFTKIDCSMYTHGYEVSFLVGSPPGYVGRKQKPKYAEIDSSKINVVLYDEIEKGHPKLHDQMLQILDKGEIDLLNSDDDNGDRAAEMTESKKVSFRNSIIIATSNVGSSEISRLNSRRPMGFADNDSDRMHPTKEQLDQVSFEALKQQFRRELIGRFTDKIAFHPLDDEQIGEVLDRYVGRMNEREQHRAIDVELAISPELRDKLVAEVDQRHALGARPVLDHFENTVGKEYAQHIENRSIPWRSFAYAVPAEDVYSEPTERAAFYFDRREVHEKELLLQELDEDLYKAFEQAYMARKKQSKPNRRAAQENRTKKAV